MVNHSSFKQILLVLYFTLCVTQTNIVTNKFKQLESGQSITGMETTSITTKQVEDCLLRCLTDKKCDAFQYKPTKSGNCILIYKHSVEGVEQDFEHGIIYEKGKSSVLQSVWTGPPAAFYRSFDDSDGFILKERYMQINEASLVPGKVNYAVYTEKERRQWVDLGIHTEACMTQPETCGAAGGAISLWINIIDCPDWAGILTSWAAQLSMGTLLFCRDGLIKANILLRDGHFVLRHSRPTGWFHIVLNYIGPNDGQGFRMLINGVQVDSDISKPLGLNSPGDGRIVVGRRFTYKDQQYASVQVDELLFFNGALTLDEITTLHNKQYNL